MAGLANQSVLGEDTEPKVFPAWRSVSTDVQVHLTFMSEGQEELKMNKFSQRN